MQLRLWWLWWWGEVVMIMNLDTHTLWFEAERQTNQIGWLLDG